MPGAKVVEQSALNPCTPIGSYYVTIGSLDKIRVFAFKQKLLSRVSFGIVYCTKWLLLLRQGIET